MDSRECKVTVLCTAYNHEAYIRDALEGFVRQKTDFAYEVLINDDASTDGTAAIIREYAEKYPEIIRPFYQEKNLYSRHIDIYEQIFFPQARGRYLAYCEGDDYWTDPDKLQLQADFLDAHPEYSACVHNSYKHDCVSSAPDEPYIASSEDHDVDFSAIIRGIGGVFHTSSLMGRAELLMDKQDFFYASIAVGDYPDAIWLSLNGKIRFLDRFMSVYRVHSNAASWSTGVNTNYDKFKAFVVGQLNMFDALMKYLTPEQAALTEEEILKRRYELLEIEGRSAEQLKPPFDRIYRSKDAKYKLKHWIKRSFPRLHRLYRKRQGYGD